VVNFEKSRKINNKNTINFIFLDIYNEFIKDFFEKIKIKNICYKYITMNNKQSIEDIKKIIKENQLVDRDNFIFREYTKNKNKFIATYKFFISDEIGNGKVEFISINLKNYNSYYPYKKMWEKIVHYHDNLYIHEEEQNKEYINLLVLSDISFSLNDEIINKNEIIKKFIENNDGGKCDISNFFEDMYYNEEFSKKINMDVPKMVVSNVEFSENKKYLFKIALVESSVSFCEEINRMEIY
jgi:hypothetical protein